MKKVVGILFEEEKPQQGGSCAVIFVLLIAGVIGGVWGWNELSRHLKGPDVVRRERIAEIETEKRKVVQSLKDQTDPFSNSVSESSKKEAARKLQELESERSRLLKEEVDARSEAPTPHEDADPTRDNHAPQVLRSLEGEKLPTSVTVIEPVHLLDEAGKETVVSIGTVIHIEKRASSGTLTMSINGRLFIGNESRILDGVKLSARSESSRE